MVNNFKFRDYASDNLELWNKLLKKEVFHNIESIGQGVIEDIYFNNGIFIKVLFNNNKYDECNEKIFLASRFEDFFKISNLSNIEEFNVFIKQKESEIEIAKIKEKIKNEKREKERIEKLRKDELRKQEEEKQYKRWIEYNNLCKKYKVKFYDLRINTIDEYLFKFLLQLNIDCIAIEDAEWMIDNYEDECSYILANFFRQQYITKNKEWDLIKASKYYRKSGNPEEALEFIEGFYSDDKEIMSAYWTTKGGAFRDLFKYDLAKKCAQKAILINSMAHHPYNLIGAVEFNQGNISEAMNYFKKALVLGARTLALSKKEIIDVINTLSNAQKDYVIKNFLEFNYLKYKWLKDIY